MHYKQKYKMKTIILIEDNIGGNLDDLEFSDDFLIIT